MVHKAILIALVASLLPIWRKANVDRSLNFWELLYSFATSPQEHLPVEEAVEQCKEAYREVS